MEFDQRRKSKVFLHLTKFYDNYGLKGCLAVVCIIVVVSVSLGWVIGGMKSPSIRYAKETIRFIKLDLFGGEQRVPRSVDIYDELQIFYTSEYNSLDILSTSL